MLGERISAVDCENGELNISLADGRELQVPLGWFAALARASARQRENCHIFADGYCVRWPEIGFELSSSRLLQGPANGTGQSR